MKYEFQNVLICFRKTNGADEQLQAHLEGGMAALASGAQDKHQCLWL